MPQCPIFLLGFFLFAIPIGMRHDKISLSKNGHSLGDVSPYLTSNLNLSGKNDGQVKIFTDVVIWSHYTYVIGG